MRYSRAFRFTARIVAGLVCLTAVAPLSGIPGQPAPFVANAKTAAVEPASLQGSSAGAAYAINVTSITGGPDSSPPTFYTNNVTVSGNVSANSFGGLPSQYHVEVNWGDGSIPPGFTTNLTVVDKSFTGTWTSSPGHAYATSGNYTITAALYHGQPPGRDGAADAVTDPITVVVVIPPAIVGVVYDDANWNMKYDIGLETGIGGVTVIIGGTESRTVTTMASGLYYFDNLTAGDYMVTETNPAGYISTTPDTIIVSGAAPEHVYTVDFGDFVSGGDKASIVGTVFSDNVTTNGIQDPGEGGIPGVTLTLDNVTSTTTNALGQYSFLVRSAGAHLLTETDLPGYYSTTLNTVSVNMTLGSSYTQDFGDLANAPGKSAVYGIVFEDTSRDGVYELGEAGIPGVTVTLVGVAANVTTTTLWNGMYSFGNVDPGSYIVKETNPSGYKSTSPDEIYLLTAPNLIDQVNFGDVKPNSTAASVYGTVFNDANGDAVRQIGELGISGVTVKLNGIEATTGAYGEYTFNATFSGNFTVNETDPPGYYSTTPNVVPVEVIFGNSYPVDFGDTLLSTCNLTISPKSVTNQLPGATTSTFTITLKDQRGVGLPGLPIAITRTFGTLSATNVVTGAHGAASFTISSSTQGSSTVTATLGPLSDAAAIIWLAAPTPPGGGGGLPPPSPTPTPTPTPTSTPTPAPQPSQTPAPVLYFNVDFLGRVTMAPMSKDGWLLEDLDAPSPDGTHLLRLPKGTLTLDKQGKIVNAIKIRVAEIVPELPSGNVILGKAYDFTPSGITFDGQVRLSLGYNASELPGKVVSVSMNFHTPETAWVEMQTEPGVIAGIGTLTAPVKHFSIFAVLAKTALASPVATGAPVFGAANLAVTRAHNTFWSYFPLVTVDGKDVKLSADVTNSGSQKGDWDLVLKIDGRTKGQTRVSLDVAQTRNMIFSVGGNLPGRHRVQLGNLTGEFATVWTVNWLLLVPVVIIAAVVGFLISMYIRRLQAARAKARS